MKKFTLFAAALAILMGFAALPSASAADPGDAPGDYGGWRFDRGMGWRYEVRSGYWSPHYVWWWVGGRAVLGPDPVEHSVKYDNGNYELKGDGIEIPYYWAWISSSGIPEPPTPPEPLPQDAPRQPPPPKREPPREYARPPVYAPEPGYARVAPPPPPPRVARSSDKTVGGTIIGGTVGGVLGAVTTRGRDRFAGVLIGSLIGGLIGHEIGKKLDDADELRAMAALEKNRTGQSSTWVNPDSGAEVTVVPRRTWQNAEGEYCREYETEVVIGGEVKKAFGTACRQPDGEWKVVR